ncbi:MAG: hypothetical protein ACI9W4_001863 [Rhodothermales bacterium]|jgi:hypothetical protein
MVCRIVEGVCLHGVSCLELTCRSLKQGLVDLSPDGIRNNWTPGYTIAQRAGTRIPVLVIAQGGVDRLEHAGRLLRGTRDWESDAAKEENDNEAHETGALETSGT